MIALQVDMLTQHILVVAVGSCILFTLISTYLISFFMTYQRKQKQNELEKKALELHYANEINKTQIEISEATLKRISQEIHDNIGQSLTLASIQLNAFSQGSSDGLQDTKQLIHRSLEDLRQLSRSLNNTFQLDLGIENAIKRELNLLQNTNKLETYLHTEEKNDIIVDHLNDQSDLVLFRCFQEATSNILKYAQANSIRVHLYFVQDHAAALCIEDNGKGINKSTFHFGIGTKSMQQRTTLMQGEFSLWSNETGTTLCFVLHKELKNIFTPLTNSKSQII